MNKKLQTATIAVLLVFVFGCMACNLLTPARAFSDMENRTLQQMPAFSLRSLFEGEFTSKFETYLTDQFFARDAWVGGKYLAERAMLKTENNGVYFGKNNRLLDRFDTPDAERIETNLSAVAAISENAGVPVYFSLIPTSAYIYQDELPWNAPSYDQQLLLDQARERLPEQYFDLSQTLLAHRDEYTYYKTDHHWTSLGAYYAYVEICAQMGLAPVELPENPQQLEGFYGTLLSQAGVRFYPADTIALYPFDNLTLTDHEGKDIPLYDMSYADQKDKYSVFLSGNHPLLVVKNSDNPSGKKLLLIKDSFSNSLLPFLAQNFSEVHMIDPRYNKTSVHDYVAQNGIDETLVLYQTANFAEDSNIFFISK